MQFRGFHRGRNDGTALFGAKLGETSVAAPEGSDGGYVQLSPIADLAEV